MQSPRKEVWPDALRVWATVSVLVIHTAMASRAVGFNPDLIFGVLSRAAVPVFLMLSGALLLGREHELGDFLKRRLMRVLLPFLFWSCLYSLFDYSHILAQGYRFDALYCLQFVAHRLRTISYYHLWYVYVILGIYLFVPFLARMVRHSPPNDLLFFLGIWFAARLLAVPSLNHLRPFIDLQNFTGYTSYLVLGYYLGMTRIRHSFRKGLALYLLMVLVTAVGSYYAGIENGYFSDRGFYDYLAPNIILMGVGVFLMGQGMEFNSEGRAHDVRNFISDHSYGVYLIHPFVLLLLAKVGITWDLINPYVGIPITALACLAVSCGVIWGMRKLPLGKYVAG